MKIGIDEVRRVAALACLEFEAGGEAQMAEEMSRILDYVDQIRDVPSDPDGSSLQQPPVRLRDDVAGESLPADVVGASAPRFSRGHFIVPKVIGGE
ncbi:MAG: Asp-tRNA(Asn)/Glu-tRNA(Gln) amidotransferase subunit GatC [Acidobacteria bacterium]|nr:Asp-tRNA(Asn)/Glu-tRNA(Gln) amidotransferase subunit GatC [Acidobacteriota bacterium]